MLNNKIKPTVFFPGKSTTLTCLKNVNNFIFFSFSLLVVLSNQNKIGINLNPSFQFPNQNRSIYHQSESIFYFEVRLFRFLFVNPNILRSGKPKIRFYIFLILIDLSPIFFNSFCLMFTKKVREKMDIKFGFCRL